MLRIFIALSLLANAVLAVVLFRGAVSSRLSERVALPPSVSAADATQDGASPAPGRAEATTAAIAAVEWRGLPTGDLPQLVARLRAAGLPPSMMRAVISGILGMEYSARRNALTAGEDAAPYWRDPSARRDPKVGEEMRALGREHARILRDLLGPEPLTENDEAYHWARRRYGDLPLEKLTRMRDIDRDYDELGIQRQAGGLMLPGDRDFLAMLAKEREADLAAVLTPEEFERYQLRSSATASFLRWQAAAFSPTEAEFRALYLAARVADEKLGPLGNMWTSEMVVQRAEVMKTELSAVFSADRLEEFMQLSDPQYGQVAKLVSRLQLPASTTRDVVAIQKDVTARAEAIRGDVNLDNDERTAALERLAQETDARLSTTFGGQRGLAAYKLNGGSWLGTIRTGGAIGFRP